MPIINITNRYLDDIKWTGAALCRFTTGNNADIWRICVSENLAFCNSFLAAMQPEEISRANRYFYTADRNRYIISRGALRSILGKYLNQPPASIKFGVGINKKPYIINNDEVHFNVSHSGNWVLLAIANSAIGADTELIKDDFDYHEIIKENFSLHEINYINQNQLPHCFYKLWTRKEALLKATGKGIDDNLKLIPALNGAHTIDGVLISSTAHWIVNSFMLYEQYAASVAVCAQTGANRFWHTDFNIIGL